MKTNLDMDVLRTFVTGTDMGSFSKAAEKLGRSPSAVSTQLRRLEDQIGQRVVEKSGRGLVPTGAGESLLSYARRILELNDEAIETIRGANVEGWVRLGMPPDFAETWLPSALARFSRMHPKVRFEVRVERNAALMDRTERGTLDLALVWLDGMAGSHREPVADLPLAWIGEGNVKRTSATASEPVSLVAFERPCLFRKAAIEALDDAGISWRLVFTSPSLTGLWAAVEAGLGVTLRTRLGVPSSLSVLDQSPLPPVPTIGLAWQFAETNPSHVVRRFADVLIENIRNDFALGS